MDQKKREHLKQLLLQHKSEDETLIASMQQDAITQSSKATAEELSSYDNHPADVATEVFQQEHALGLKAMHTEHVKEIEEAINRLEEENFGLCCACGQKIDEERLEILPESKLCIACAYKKDEDIKNTREALRFKPPTERKIRTPLGVKNLDNPFQPNRDDKDIFDDLMQYGSAQSPSEEGNYRNFKELYDAMDRHEGLVEDTDGISNQEYEDQLPG